MEENKEELRYLTTQGEIKFEICHEFRKTDLKQIKKIVVNVDAEPLTHMRIGAEIIYRRICKIIEADNKTFKENQQRLMSKKERECFTAAKIAIERIMSDLQSDLVKQAKQEMKAYQDQAGLVVPLSLPETDE